MRYAKHYVPHREVRIPAERFYVIGTKFPITQKKTDACMLRTHHLPCHILIVILYVIYLHSAKTIFSRVRVGIFASKYLRILLLLTVSQVILDSGYHPRNQLIKFELLTQSITRLTPQSAVAPPVRMGLTNLLVGKQ